jgi:hypothetical protein
MPEIYRLLLKAPEYKIQLINRQLLVGQISSGERLIPYIIQQTTGGGEWSALGSGQTYVMIIS